MYGMYVHIKAVTYVTFLNKQDFLQSWSGRSTRGNVKHVYILAVCPYNVCDVLHCQLNMALDQDCWKRHSLPCERELPKHKNCERTNGVITHYVLKL